jgi:putative PIN family toxin of toxin-antitoxin system
MRVVLDTNTLVSALLFRGTACRLVPLWQSGRMTLLVSRPILEEYLRVFAYPKFRLTEQEIRGLVEEEVLPFVETVRPTRQLLVPCRDPEDQKFLECAVTGRARYLVTGDQDLRVLGTYRRVSILNVGEFLEAIRS